MAIFGKLAYEDGVSTLTLLFVRFALATLIFGVLLAARPATARSLRGAGTRTLAIGLGLGAIGYATQAGLFFAALQRLDASLLALVLYTFPAWVMLGSFALGREQPTRRRVVALALSSAGLVVLLAGASAGAVDAAGVAMGLGAAVAYTVYILVADRAGLEISPLALTTLVCVGAACTLGLVGVVSGSLDLALSADAWLWLGLIAVVSTAVPIVAVLRRPRAGRPQHRRDPLDLRAGRHRRARLPRVQRGAHRHPARRAPCSCWRPRCCSPRRRAAACRCRRTTEPPPAGGSGYASARTTSVSGRTPSNFIASAASVALHGGLPRREVRDLDDQAHPVRAGRVAERAHGDAQRPEELLALGRREPVIDVVHLVEADECRHGRCVLSAARQETAISRCQVSATVPPGTAGAMGPASTPRRPPTGATASAR